jgi:probable phosphoglycerate mutase
MTVLLLIRHGENDYVGKRLAGRLPGVHLNERGRKQAEALVPALQKAPLKAIYSSPLERAQETAEPLAKARGLEILPAPDLNELDVGIFTGRTIKQLRRLRQWKAVLANPSTLAFPEGESFLQAQTRSVEALKAIAAQHPEDVVAVFTHADVIRLATAYFLNVPLESFQRLGADTTSLTMVVLGKDGEVHVPRVNQVVSFAWPEEKKKEKKNPDGASPKDKKDEQPR